ncbi:MAG: sigma-70 family RNA polymerase sigma factor [Chloroflexota bacterium]|nr:sigma-70 family RNA polymerase sigma factor [Chloroflexota bacterium]
MVSPPDDELMTLRAAIDGDLDAFNLLLTRCQDAAFSIAYRMTGDRALAADMVQEAVITAYRGIRTLRGERFRPWLLRIVVNRCTDELRRRRRRPTVSLTPDQPDSSDDELPIPDSAPLPEEVAQTRELHAAIQACIDRLSLDQRAVLVLCDIEEMDYQAIADTVGTQVGTVKSRLSRARAAVRDCLQSSRELLPAVYRLYRQDDDRNS